MRPFIQNIPGSKLIRSTWRTVVHLWKPMAGWTLLIWAAIGIILAPISSAVLGLQFFRNGELLIGNEQLLSWLFSPVGIGYILLAATLALTGWILRFAGLFQIVANDVYGETVSVQHTLLRISNRIHILFRLCLFITTAGLLLLIPLGAGVGLIYELLLDTYDINYYLTSRPIEWYSAVILSILWVFIWLVGTVYLVARCLIALPAYLHSQKSIRESITYAWKMGHTHSKDNLKSILSAIGFWIAIRFLVDAVLFTIFAGMIGWVSNYVDSLRIIALITGCYLITSLTFDAIFSFLGFSYVSTLISKLYFRDFRKLPNTPRSRHTFKRLASFFKNMFKPKWLLSTVGAAIIGSFMLSGYIIAQIPQPESSNTVQIAAHRAGPPPAPENTLEALHHTLQTEAELAEIDVQLSRDSVVVAAHDADLMRIANSPTRISETSYKNLQHIIGKAHSRSHSIHQKIYTLDDFLAASNSKIRLMIELKQSDQALGNRVVSAIREQEMEEEVIVMAMNLDAVRHIQKIAPEITVGYVSAFSLGDTSQLPVDLLVINHRAVTSRLITEARQQGLQVYAWTVNSISVMTNMIEHKVDGIITDKPELGIQVRDEMQELTTAERLLLQFPQLLQADIL